MRERDDHALVELTVAGDSDAFAELYERYFDNVFDFLARMVRDQSQAADLAQDTFIKAMNGLASLNKGASFKSWLFTIARNTALNHVQRSSRLQPLESRDDEGEEYGFDVVDGDRFGSPEEAAEAESLAALVWEAAKALDERQYSVLHLTAREGLDSAEIADVLGVTKNNAYVMVNRMKKTLEEAIGALVLFRNGRRDCAQLDRILVALGVSEMSADVRRTIDRHVARCDVCAERRRKMASPFAVFGGFAPIAAPFGVKTGIWEQLQQSYPYGAASAEGGNVSPDGQEGGEASSSGAGTNGAAGARGATATALEEPHPGSSTAFSSALGTAEDGGSHRRRFGGKLLATAAGVVLLLAGGAGALVLASPDDKADEAAGVLSTPGVSLALAVSATSPATSTPISTATPVPSETPAPTAEVEAAAAPADPEAVAPADDGGPSPVEPGPEGPEVAPPPGEPPAEAPPAEPDPGFLPPAPPPDDGPPPAGPAQPCVPFSVVGPSVIDFGSTASVTSFHLEVQGCDEPSPFRVEVGSPWIASDLPGGDIPPGGIDVTLSIERGALAPGSNTGRFSITTVIGVLEVLVYAEEPRLVPPTPAAPTASAPPPTSTPTPFLRLPATATPTPQSLRLPPTATPTPRGLRLVPLPTPTPCRSTSIFGC